VPGYSEQLASAGISMDAILEAAMDAAEPAPGLRWLDVGCGTGNLLRVIKAGWQPAALWGLDPIDWLADDLREEVEFRRLGAEQALDVPVADRVMMIEVIEHLEAPWTALRAAARLVAPGGRIVVSTPNLASLRTRLELGVRGRFTAFRPENDVHVSPAPPHVTARILREEGLLPEPPRYAGSDVIPLSGGRVWPAPLMRRSPVLTSVSVIVAAGRPRPVLAAG